MNESIFNLSTEKFAYPTTTILREEFGHVIRQDLDKFDSERYESMLETLAEWQSELGFRLTFSEDSTCVSLSNDKGCFAGLPAYDCVIRNLGEAISWVQKTYNHYPGSDHV